LLNIDHYLCNSLLHLASRLFGGHGAHTGWWKSVRSPSMCTSTLPSKWLEC